VFNHHADGRPVSREPGLAALRAIVTPAVGEGVLLLGDFNEYPEAPAVRGLIDAGLTDLGGILNMETTPSGRIDYLLADEALTARASGARVWSTDLSDHHAVVADLGW
jgi:endonuclease/exonuclease/phosphatase family metal-dependent hydrolase